MNINDFKDTILRFIALNQINEAESLFNEEADNFEIDNFISLIEIGIEAYKEENGEYKHTWYSFVRLIFESEKCNFDEDVLLKDPYTSCLVGAYRYGQAYCIEGEEKIRLFNGLSSIFTESYNGGCKTALHYYYRTAILNLDDIGENLYSDKLKEREKAIKERIEKLKERVDSIEYIKIKKEYDEYDNEIKDIYVCYYSLIRIAEIIEDTYEESDAREYINRINVEVEKRIDEIQESLKAKSKNFDVNEDENDEVIDTLADGMYYGFRDVDAQYMIGICYETGLGGVKQDHVEAAKWYGKAAEQGHVDANNDLKRLMRK